MLLYPSPALAQQSLQDLFVSPETPQWIGWARSVLATSSSLRRRQSSLVMAGVVSPECSVDGPEIFGKSSQRHLNGFGTRKIAVGPKHFLPPRSAELFRLDQFLELRMLAISRLPHVGAPAFYSAIGRAFESTFPSALAPVRAVRFVMEPDFPSKNHGQVPHSLWRIATCATSSPRLQKTTSMTRIHPARRLSVSAKSQNSRTVP